MVFVASLLVFGLIGGGLFALAVVRNRLRDEDEGARELPPEVLISIARAHDAELARRAGDKLRSRGAEI
jgi:hypothetical protein